MPVPLDCQAQINFVKTDGFRSGKKLIQLFRDVQLFPRDESVETYQTRPKSRARSQHPPVFLDRERAWPDHRRHSRCGAAATKVAPSPIPNPSPTVQIHFRNFIARITQRGDLTIQSPVSEWGLAHRPPNVPHRIPIWVAALVGLVSGKLAALELEQTEEAAPNRRCTAITEGSASLIFPRHRGNSRRSENTTKRSD